MQHSYRQTKALNFWAIPRDTGPRVQIIKGLVYLGKKKWQLIAQIIVTIIAKKIRTINFAIIVTIIAKFMVRILLAIIATIIGTINFAIKLILFCKSPG